MVRSKPDALERVLRRDRLITASSLAVLCGLAWLYLASGAGMGVSISDTAVSSVLPYKTFETASPPGAMPDMVGVGGMTGMAGMSGSTLVAWRPAQSMLILAMWATMMVAMMMPSAAPAILLYGRVVRHAAPSGADHGLAPSWAFSLGYLLVWGLFSLLATGLQWLLEQGGVLSPGLMGLQSRWFSASVLAAAGIYQLSPLHAACLKHCRSPAVFFSRHWRPGFAGALRLGALHGGYCLGCCWLLMTLLFVGGVMNVLWIAGLSGLILAEKLLPGGQWIARAAGVVLIAWSAATLMI